MFRLATVKAWQGGAELPWSAAEWLEVLAEHSPLALVVRAGVLLIGLVPAVERTPNAERAFLPH